MAKGIYERKGKNGDITYYIRYQVDGVDIKERVGRKSRGCTKEIAKEALRARQGEVIQGKFSLNRARKAIPFSQLAKRFHDYAKVNWRAYEDNKNFITYPEREFGDLPLSEITSWRIEQWKSKLRQNHKPGTVNVYLATLKNMLFRAVEWGLLKSNPASSVRAIKLGDQRARYLSLDELKRLLDACGESWLRHYVVLALNTGLRRSEMLGLRRNQNIDLERGMIVIRQQKTQRVKTIPLNESARKAILDQNGSPSIDNRLFPVSDSALSIAFEEALERARITDFRVHDLRHSFASHLLMAGSDLATVSRLMGHTNLAMTMRYAHLSQRHEADAVAKLDLKLAQSRNTSEDDEPEVTEIPEKQAANGVYVT